MLNFKGIRFRVYIVEQNKRNEREKKIENNIHNKDLIDLMKQIYEVARICENKRTQADLIHNYC